LTAADARQQFEITMVLWSFGLGPARMVCPRLGATGSTSRTEMKASKTRRAASWSDVKARLTHFDRDGLVGLVHDLYTANKDNQVFLHTRFGLGEDVLEPYKATINRWLWPDMFRNQNASVAEAKKAIANYKKAIGQSDGLAELMVYYCERASGFSAEVGLQDEGFFIALVRMFEQALQAIARLPAAQRLLLMERLDAVHHISQNIGYGVDDAMRDILVEYGTYD
jgi:hypothetical protein